MKRHESFSSLKKEASIAFIGFSIFDILHILAATVILVFAYSQRPVREMDAACSSVELCFAALLILFVVTLAKRQDDPAKLRNSFTFCCIVAALAVFVPASFWLPELVHGDWMASEEVPILIMVMVNATLTLTAAVLFAIAQIVDENTQGGAQWRKLLFAGNILFILSAVTGVVTVILERKYPVWIMVFDCIGQAAPLFPGILIFWRLSRSSTSTDLY